MSSFGNRSEVDRLKYNLEKAGAVFPLNGDAFVSAIYC
jgi:hypothetical protein